MRRVCLLVVLLAAGPARAQPVSFKIKAAVPRGKKPLLKVRAHAKMTDLRVALRRDDGERFRMRRARLAKGQTVTFRIGDGAAGRAKYRGTMSARIGDRRWKRKLSFETLIRAPLRVRYDREHLDLEDRVLRFQLSRRADRAAVVVIGESGKKIGRGKASYSGAPAGKWLPIRWKQAPNTRVMKMKLRVVAQNGLSTRVELVPWSVTVEHEDVNFPTGSADIPSGEFEKLDASLAEIRRIAKRSGRFMKMKLYIAGHTDTVDSAAKNRKLSRARARAIGRYFRRKGLRIPIAVAGFGEHVLEVKTPDETDEAANRRVDYVLGPARGSPPFSGPYRKVRARWRAIQ